ncbi:MAG: NAD(P)/FAD-dependent oxidoreductase, partial [Desulfurococcaceae archaeon]
MSKKITIIGAGPAGLYTALHIEKHDVNIIEEHSKPGVPRHCAGLVSYTTARLIQEISPKLIDQSYRKIQFITPEIKTEIKFKNPVIYHVKRPLLEEKLASLVESKGHIILYDAKAKPRDKKTIYVSKNIVEYNILIAADGARSIFRKSMIPEKTKYLHGIQLEARARNIDPDTITVIYSSDNPYFFGWITPLSNDIVQIGYASIKPRIEALYKLAKSKANIEITSTMEIYGGLIPIHKPVKNPMISGNTILHGDSVPLTKPYTGGGLYY